MSIFAFRRWLLLKLVPFALFGKSLTRISASRYEIHEHRR